MERRRKHRLILFFEMKNGISPEYLTHLISQPQAQPYALRNRADVPVIPCNTQALNDRFTTDANSSVSLKVQGFIAESNRFDAKQLIPIGVSISIPRDDVCDR